jgi:hypothetical protein
MWILILRRHHRKFKHMWIQNEFLRVIDLFFHLKNVTHLLWIGQNLGGWHKFLVLSILFLQDPTKQYKIVPLDVELELIKTSNHHTSSLHEDWFLPSPWWWNPKSFHSHNISRIEAISKSLKTHKFASSWDSNYLNMVWIQDLWYS